MNTHKIFSNSVLSLIKSGNLQNFLRLGFIQKMFFVHNRFYNYKFLKKILSKKSEFWIKLLSENSVGNPVPFFLYDPPVEIELGKYICLNKVLNMLKLKM